MGQGRARSEDHRRVTPARDRKLELITSKAAVDRDHGPCYVACTRRCEKHDEIGELLGLAVATDGYLVLGLPGTVLRRVVSTDLIAHDAARRHAIHRDAVLADLARQAFRPRVHCCL